MKHHLVQEDRAVETPNGNAITALATPSRGAGDVSIIRQQQQVGGFNPPHFHDREEVIVVLAGRVTVHTAEETALLGTGDTLIIPARTIHSLENTGDTPAEWLIVATSGVRFFPEDGDEMHPGWAK